MDNRITDMRALLTAAVLLASLLTFESPAIETNLALVGAKVYPSPTETPIEDATILIHEGRIVAVGPSSEVHLPKFARAVTVIDCKGLFIVPGFWNSHVHFMEKSWDDAATADPRLLEQHMQEMLTRWGFTSVFDVASFLANTNALRNRVNGGEVPGPHIFTTGEPLYPKGGIPVYLGPEWNIPQAVTPEDARRMARQRMANGADGIKVFAGAITRDGVLPMDTAIIRAAVEVAHAAGKPVFAHPSNRAGTDNALVGGADVLAHTIPMEDAFTPGELQRMKAQDVALIPTISLFPDEERKFGGTPEDGQAVTKKAIAQLKSYFDLGGTILFGTDVGYTQLYDTTSEYEYMSQSGMTWRDILASLTTSPAKFFKAANTGKIAKGFDADVVVLSADPQNDPRNFAAVVWTIRGGQVLYHRK